MRIHQEQTYFLQKSLALLEIKTTCTPWERVITYWLKYRISRCKMTLESSKKHTQNQGSSYRPSTKTRVLKPTGHTHQLSQHNTTHTVCQKISHWHWLKYQLPLRTIAYILYLPYYMPHWWHTNISNNLQVIHCNGISLSQLFSAHRQPSSRSKVKSNPCMALLLTEKYNMTKPVSPPIIWLIKLLRHIFWLDS